MKEGALGRPFHISHCSQGVTQPPPSRTDGPASSRVRLTTRHQTRSTSQGFTQSPATRRSIPASSSITLHTVISPAPVP